MEWLGLAGAPFAFSEGAMSIVSIFIYPRNTVTRCRSQNRIDFIPILQANGELYSEWDNGAKGLAIDEPFCWDDILYTCEKIIDTRLHDLV